MERIRGEAAVVVAATVAAALAWTAWRAGGLHLAVGAGGRDVGLVAVVVTAVLAAGLGAVSRRRFTRRPGGERRWLVLAALTLLVSLVGPLGAASVAAGLALASLHLVVAVVVVVGLTRLDVVRRPAPAAQA